MSYHEFRLQEDITEILREGNYFTIQEIVDMAKIRGHVKQRKYQTCEIKKCLTGLIEMGYVEYKEDKLNWR